MKYSVELSSKIPAGKHDIREILCYSVLNNENEEVAEFWLIFDEKVSVAYITSVEVKEEFRGRKIGKFVMEEIIQILRFVRVKSCYLFVHFDNEIAQNLYKKFGFSYNGEITENSNYRMEKMI
jgi:ribosomal protein S18 acetylase RimI-like enzyme